ncbi:MAG: DUF1735 domain-containing protein, partial [Prevotellaceae bacterium]|nr:DUF1735 domain-containing protein [Prevotellaceae bacterium]MDY5210636.1 DUF1735 domain-containing protein [Prevotella sp.]
MKLNNIFKYMSAAVLALGFASCENGDNEFPDYEEQTVYFPYQYPVRTLVMGDDEYDTTLDKQHKCKIMATFGGSYNGSNGSVEVAVDNSLVNNLTFGDGTPIKAMPESYYTLSTKTLAFNGTYNGSTEVQLTDAFFNDPDAAKGVYVIPLVMTSQKGFTRILSGTPNEEGATPSRLDEGAWKVKPMDYVLYCVKYLNKYSGYWLAEGKDIINDEIGQKTQDRKAASVEKRNVIKIETKSLSQSILTVSYPFEYNDVDKDGNPKISTKTLTADLLLTFDGSDNCTITSATDGVTASGNG